RSEARNPRFSLHQPALETDGADEEGVGRVRKDRPPAGGDVAIHGSEGGRQVRPGNRFGSPEPEGEVAAVSIVADTATHPEAEKVLAGDETGAPAGEVESHLARITLGSTGAAGEIVGAGLDVGEGAFADVPESHLVERTSHHRHR